MRARAVGVGLLCLALAGCASLPGLGSEPSSTRAAASPTPSPAPFAGLTGREIWNLADEAAAAATSVRMVGRATDDKGRPMTVDLVTSVGDRARVSVRIEAAWLSILRGDDEYYARGNRAYWVEQLGKQNGSRVAELNQERWLLFDDDRLGPLEPLLDRTGPAGVLDWLIDEPEGDTTGEWTKAIRRLKGRTVDGVPTIGLHIPGEPEQLYVAAKGEPYPLLWVDKDGLETRFTDWNARLTFSVPTGPQVLRLPQQPDSTT